MSQKATLFLMILGCLLTSCTVGIVNEDNVPGLFGTPTPDLDMQATLTALQAQNVALATRMASLEQTQTPAPTPTLTPTSSAVRVVVLATSTPTQTPTPVSTPCGIAVGADFQSQLAQASQSDSVGCPIAAQERIWTAEQAFEGGRMFWREDRDDAFVLFASGGKFLITSDVYNEGEPDDICPELGSAPAGYFKPLRGFNRQWCKHGEVREQLGWALENEAGYEAAWQAFDRGVIVKNRAGHLFILYHNGSWSYVE